jgi:hypothetical protein
MVWSTGYFGLLADSTPGSTPEQTQDAVNAWHAS